MRQHLPNLPGNRVQLRITRNSTTGNPVCQLRKPNSNRQLVVPIVCQGWLAGGTLIEAVSHEIETRKCYTFLDVACIGGRSLATASHRERLAALVSIARSIRDPTELAPNSTPTAFNAWPLFALAPVDDNLAATAPQPTTSFDMPFLQVYKNLQEANSVYVEDHQTAKAAKLVNAFPCPAHKPSNKAGVSAAPKRNIQLHNGASKHPRPTTETIIVRAGSTGPDDYVGVGVDSKKEGGVLVRRMDTSLKLNRLLRGTNVELYKASAQRTGRVLKSVKLEAKWCASTKQWLLATERSQ